MKCLVNSLDCTPLVVLGKIWTNTLSEKCVISLAEPLKAYTFLSCELIKSDIEMSHTKQYSSQFNEISVPYNKIGDKRNL